MKKILFSLLMLCCMTAAWAQPWPSGVYEVGTLERFKEVISHRMANDKCIAEIKLTADIYLNDCPELCRTFTGTLDGNGYTIYAGDANAPHDGRGFAHGKYLFTYSEGATFKNLTFKDFRADTDEHSNWSFLTSQATDGCVFENITFDHVSLWAKLDNGGAVAGYANGCTFRNITVKNGDFTVSRNSAGTVVGHATSCTFTNIEVSNCDATSEEDHAGGVVGHSNNCTFTDINVHDCNITAHNIEAGGVAGIAENNSLFSNIEINTCEVTAKKYQQAGGVVGNSNNCTFTDVQVKNSFIKTYRRYSGGVVGISSNSHYTNCIIDDQTCVFANGDTDKAIAGGIVGKSDNDGIHYCINSALVAADKHYAGGIAGDISNGTIIESCLNTGMVISIDSSDLEGANGYYSKYKNNNLRHEIKYYKGKEYVVRVSELGDTGDQFFGGIAGQAYNATVTKCTNFGSFNNSTSNAGIVAEARYTTISDCLSYFSSADKVYGIISWGAYGSLSNSLDLSGKISYDWKNYEWSGMDNNITNFYKKNITDAQLALGETCTKLGVNWEQNLGTDPYPTPTGDKGVYHSRNVKNTYGTVCLPFAVKSDDNVRFYLLDKVNNGEDKVTIGFKYTETLEAGHPALFSVDNSGDITFTPSDNEWADQPYSHGYGDDWHFVGTYKATVFDGDAAKSIYYVSGDMIRNAKKTTIAPYRAYFEGPSIETLKGSNSGQAKSIRFVIEDADGSTTALEFVGNDLKPVQNGKSYSIMGTEVDENYRGIVIKNGKKILKK